MKKTKSPILFLDFVANIIYAFLSVALILVSLGMVGYSFWEIWIALQTQTAILDKLLDSIGFIVISMAVFDVAKYLLEEEVLRDRELRSAGEARETLTKFMVIISIAVSLEALVFIFQAGKHDMPQLIYPTILMFVSVCLVVGLGIYQKLSREVEIKYEK